MFGMALAGPYVWGFIPHIVSLAFLIDILAKRLPHFLIFIPIALYGAYYAVWLTEFTSIKLAENRIQTENKLQNVAFDRKRDALVYSNAQSFVTSHEIAVAYEPNPNFPEGYLSYRLVTADKCSDLWSAGVLGEKGLGLFYTCWPVGDASQKYGWSSHVQKLQMPDHPDKEPIEAIIDNDSKSYGSGYRRSFFGIWFQSGIFGPSLIHEQVYTFRRADKILAVYKMASIARLPWFPFLTVGCGLNSASASWGCFAGFNRSNKYLDTTPISLDKSLYGVEPVAVVLKIPEYKPETFTSFADFSENIHFIDMLLMQKKNEKPEDFDEWGLRKDSIYQPKIGERNGYPSFEGVVYSGNKGGPFRDFIKQYEGKVVYLDIEAKPNARQNSFMNYGVCKVSEKCNDRTDNSYQFRNDDDSWHNFEEEGKFKGFFLVGSENLFENQDDKRDKDTITILTFMPSEKLDQKGYR